jgi:hypothetical protein
VVDLEYGELTHKSKRGFGFCFGGEVGTQPFFTLEICTHDDLIPIDSRKITIPVVSSFLAVLLPVGGGFDIPDVVDFADQSDPIAHTSCTASDYAVLMGYADACDQLEVDVFGEVVVPDVEVFFWIGSTKNEDLALMRCNGRLDIMSPH